MVFQVLTCVFYSSKQDKVGSGMTFILNILHKNFSLLASDRKATAKGPCTINMPGITIHAKDGATIQGVKKIYLSSDKLQALGIAGNTQEHPYTAVIEQSTSINESLRSIRQHMEGFLCIEDRASVLKLGSYMENQGIVTFFDSDQNSYFSNLHVFSVLHNATKIFWCDNNGSLLIHIGSGSNSLEQAVGRDEILKFAASVQSIEQLDHCLEWLKLTYKKVSTIDPGSGEDFVAVLSTRDNPEFRTVSSE